jgi:hypothetical protein
MIDLQAQAPSVRGAGARPAIQAASLTSIEQMGAASIISGSMTGLVLTGLAAASVVNPLWLLIPLLVDVVGAVCIAKGAQAPTRVESPVKQESQSQTAVALKPSRARVELAQRNIVEQNRFRPNNPMQRWKKTVDVNGPLPRIDIDGLARSDLVLKARSIQATKQATKMKRQRLVSMGKNIQGRTLPSVTPKNIPPLAKAKPSILGTAARLFVEGVNDMGNAVGNQVKNLAKTKPILTYADVYRGLDQ